MKSITETVKKVQAFEESLGLSVGVVRYDFENDLRRAFEREARENLGGLDFSSADLCKALSTCDTVEAMQKAITKHVKPFAGTPDALRKKELFRALRLDTEKLLGVWGYEKLVQTYGKMVKAATVAALNKKGLLLNPGGSDYNQKDGLYKLAQLVAKVDPTVDAQKVWEVYHSDLSAYPLGQVTAFQNGKMTIKGMKPAHLEAVADGLAVALADYAKNQ